MSSSDNSDVLDLLREHYRAAPAPAPSGALLARMDAGALSPVDEVVATPVDELAARRDRRSMHSPAHGGVRRRVRGAVAAVAVTFVATSGLAAADVLPDPVQREVSSFASHFGIDLPTPDAPDVAPADRNGDTGSEPGQDSRPANEGSTATSVPGGVPLPGGAAPATLPPGAVDPNAATGAVPEVPPTVTVPDPPVPDALDLPIPDPGALPLPLPTITLPTLF